MKIWLINHYAVPPKYYPLARQTYFAKNLMKLGHEVTVFAASTVHNSDLNLIEDKTPYRDDYVDGVHYVYIRCRGYQGNGAARIINMCEFAAKLPRVCAKYPRPDAIVSTSMPPMSCAMGVHLARKYHVRGIAEIADLWPETIVAYGIAGPRNPAVVALRILEKWIYKKADAVIFTCERGYDYIVERHWEKSVPREKVFYVNNGVDLKLFDFNKENYLTDDPDLTSPDTFKVIYTGSIRRINNLGRLLDAAKLVKNDKIRFLIWGGGDELDALKSRVEDEKIKNVSFKGKVEKKYIPYITSCADLNIMHGDPGPVLRFGLSANKLFDYPAAGKPILTDFPCGHNPAKACGASIEIEEYGAQGIAEAIDSCAAMPQETRAQIGAKARNVAAEYDFANLTKKLLSVIEGK